MSEKYHHRVPKWLMADYEKKMAAMSPKERNFAKEVNAEHYMEKTAGQRGLKMTVTPADKGMVGGPDGDMRAPSQPVRGEAKAENSKLSRGQRNPVKTLQKDAAKAEKGIGQFQKSSRLDRLAAQQTRTELERGGSVRYEVYRTRATSTGFETKVSGRNYALRETGTQGGPVTTTRSPEAIGSGFKTAGERTTALPSNVRAGGARSGTGAASPSGLPKPTGGLGGQKPGGSSSGGVGGGL